MVGLEGLEPPGDTAVRRRGQRTTRSPRGATARSAGDEPPAGWSSRSDPGWTVRVSQRPAGSVRAGAEKRIRCGPAGHSACLWLRARSSRPADGRSTVRCPGRPNGSISRRPPGKAVLSPSSRVGCVAGRSLCAEVSPRGWVAQAAIAGPCVSKREVELWRRRGAPGIKSCGGPCRPGRSGCARRAAR